MSPLPLPNAGKVGLGKAGVESGSQNACLKAEPRGLKKWGQARRSTKGPRKRKRAGAGGTGVWGLGEEGRREKADHSGPGDVRASLESELVKAKFVLSEVCWERICGSGVRAPHAFVCARVCRATGQASARNCCIPLHPKTSPLSKMLSHYSQAHFSPPHLALVSVFLYACCSSDSLLLCNATVKTPAFY